MSTSTFPTLHKNLNPCSTSIPPLPCTAAPTSNTLRATPKSKHSIAPTSPGRSKGPAFLLLGNLSHHHRSEPTLMARFTGHGGVKLCLHGGDRASFFGCEMRDRIVRFRVHHHSRSSVGIHRVGSSRGCGARVWALGNQRSGSKGGDFVKDSVLADDFDEDGDDYDDDDEEEEEEEEQEEELDNEFDELSCFRGLVLDISYRPVNVVCWKRAICLEFMEKADVLEYYDQTVPSAHGSFYIPAVLRVHHLLQVVQRRRIKQVLSRKSIFYRDSYTCQYCSARENLTIDHVLPVSRGGQWTWENLVAACARCNSKKGQKTLEQANMKLLKIPKSPKDFDIFTIPLTSTAARMLKRRNGVPEEWEQYLPKSTH